MLDTLLMEMHPLKVGLPFRPVQVNYLQICAKFLKGTAAGMQNHKSRILNLRFWRVLMPLNIKYAFQSDFSLRQVGTSKGRGE